MPSRRTSGSYRPDSWVSIWLPEATSPSGETWPDDRSWASAWVTVSLRTFTSLTSADSTWRTRPRALADSAAPKITMTATVRRTRTEDAARSTVSAGGQVGGPEAVALAPDRLEVGAIERSVDLAPEIPDVHLDHVGVALEVLAPHPLEQLLLADDLAGVAEQGLEEGELAGRQRDVDVAAAAAAGDDVEGEVAELERLEVVVGPAPGERLEAGDQHHERERLGEEVVGTRVERLGLVVLAVLGGQHEDRRPDLGLPQAAAHLVAVHRRQHDVEHHQVVVAFERLLVALPTVVDDGHVETFAPEAAGDALGECNLIFDHQDAHGSQSARQRPSGGVT